MKNEDQKYDANDDGQMLLCGESDGKLRYRMKDESSKAIHQILADLNLDPGSDSVAQMQAILKFSEGIVWLGRESDHIGDIHYTRNKQVSRGTEKFTIKAKSIKETFDEKGRKRIQVLSNLKTFIDCRLKALPNDA